MFHIWAKRYYLLSGNCMYYYWAEKDVRPKGVIFITGCIVDRTHERDMELKGYWGIEIMHQDMCTGEHHRHDVRTLYCKSEEERDEWVTILQHYSTVIPIEEDYVMGRELGRGRFSVVHECVNKMTNQHYAVKVIDKTTIEQEEKALLRTEIAVLKLVEHPNIIKMHALYESRKYIYIVMEMLKGGELFERIVGRPRYYTHTYIHNMDSVLFCYCAAFLLLILSCLVLSVLVVGSQRTRQPSSSVLFWRA